MKLATRLCAGLLLVCSLSGCCWSSGYFDPATGFTYGAGWYPCWWANPFCWFCHCWGGYDPYNYPYGYGYGYGWGAYPTPLYGGGCSSCGTATPSAPANPQPVPESTSFCPNCNHGHAAAPEVVYSVPEVMPGLYDGPVSEGPVYYGGPVYGGMSGGMEVYEGEVYDGIPVYQGAEAYEGVEVYEEGTVVPPADSAPPAPAAQPPAPSANDAKTSFLPPRILRRPASLPKLLRRPRSHRQVSWKKWLPASF